MNRKLITCLLIAVFLAACAPAAVSPTPEGEKGPIFISSAELLIMESFPVQVRLHVTGDLPTPCHSFHADVAAPDGENRIDVTAYSLYNPNLMCTQILQPFDESVSIPMNGQAAGTYAVYLNGELIGQFDYSE